MIMWPYFILEARAEIAKIFVWFLKELEARKIASIFSDLYKRKFGNIIYKVIDF